MQEGCRTVKKELLTKIYRFKIACWLTKQQWISVWNLLAMKSNFLLKKTDQACSINWINCQNLLLVRTECIVVKRCVQVLILFFFTFTLDSLVEVFKQRSFIHLISSKSNDGSPKCSTSQAVILLRFNLLVLLLEIVTRLLRTERKTRNEIFSRTPFLAAAGTL